MTEVHTHKVVRRGTPLLFWSATPTVSEMVYETGRWFSPGFRWATVGPATLRALSDMTAGKELYVHVFAPQQDIRLPVYALDKPTFTALQLGSVLLIKRDLPDLDAVSQAMCEKDRMGLFVPRVHGVTRCKEIFLCPKGMQVAKYIKTLSASQFLAKVRDESGIESVAHARLTSAFAAAAAAYRLEHQSAGANSGDEEEKSGARTPPSRARTVAPEMMMRLPPGIRARRTRAPLTEPLEGSPLASPHYATTPERRRRAALGLDPEDVVDVGRGTEERVRARAELRDAALSVAGRNQRLKDNRKLLATARMRRHMLMTTEDIDDALNGVNTRIDMTKERIRRDCNDKYGEEVQRDVCYSNADDEARRMAGMLIRELRAINGRRFRQRGELVSELLRRWPCPEMEPNRSLCVQAIKAQGGYI